LAGNSSVEIVVPGAVKRLGRVSMSLTAKCAIKLPKKDHPLFLSLMRRVGVKYSLGLYQDQSQKCKQADFLFCPPVNRDFNRDTILSKSAVLEFPNSYF
jgi:hypothetical protein